MYICAIKSFRKRKSILISLLKFTVVFVVTKTTKKLLTRPTNSFIIVLHFNLHFKTLLNSIFHSFTYGKHVFKASTYAIYIASPVRKKIEKLD